MKTITEYRPGLIGEILNRADRREERRAWWARFLGYRRASRTHVVKFSPTEIIYSPGR